MICRILDQEADMKNLDQVEAVIRMKDYIYRHINETLSLEEVCSVSGYSQRHALRMFKALLHKPVFAYIRDLRLRIAAVRLIRPEFQGGILDAALDAGYESHEGFTKAFGGYFGVSPQDYRRGRLPENYIGPRPMSYDYLKLRSRRDNSMQQARTVTVFPMTRPACRMILKRGIRANDYFSYYDEVGCDIWDILQAVPNRLDEVALVNLPPALIKEGTSSAVCAVEVPLEGEVTVPDGCEVIEVGERQLLCFQGAPYEDEAWYGGAHEEMGRAIEHYRPELYGFRFAYDLAPAYTFGASAQRGCRVWIPVAPRK